MAKAKQKQQQQLIGITGAAEIIGRSPDYIRERINTGKLLAFREGERGAYSIRISDLNALFKPVPAVGYNPKAMALDLSVVAA